MIEKQQTRSRSETFSPQRKKPNKGNGSRGRYSEATINIALLLVGSLLIAASFNLFLVPLGIA
ncbi:YitT family protein, partial [Paenibacillus sepulcri]|nr:YitT family protein [Paenibacillus sepulcri]